MSDENNDDSNLRIKIQRLEYLLGSLENSQNLALIGLLYGESMHFARNKLGMAKALAKNISQGDYGNNLDQIKSAADRIFESINSYLMVLERSQSAALDAPETTAVNIHEVITSVIDRKSIVLARAEITIVKRLNAVNPIIHAPSKQLEQVFLVLFQNAVDAIGNQDGKISIATDDGISQDSKIEIRINNTGSPIPNDIQDELFSYPKKHKHTTKDNRLGLGLVWVNSFLRTYNAEITFTTNDIAGTTFTLKLPRVFKPTI